MVSNNMISDNEGGPSSAGGDPDTPAEVLPREQHLQDICKAFLFQLGLYNEPEWFYDVRDEEPFHGRIRLAVRPGQTAELVWQPREDEGDDGSTTTQVFSRQELREAIERVWPRSLREFRGWGQDGVTSMLVEVGASPEGSVLGTKIPQVFYTPWVELDEKLHAEEVVWHQWCRDVTEAIPRTPQHFPATGKLRDFEPPVYHSPHEKCKGQIIYVTLGEREDASPFCFPLPLLAYLSSIFEPFFDAPEGNVIDIRPLWTFISPRFRLENFFCYNGFSQSMRYRVRYFQPVERTWLQARRLPDGGVDLTFNAAEEARRCGFLLDRQIASIGQKDRERHFVERLAMVTVTMGVEHHTNFSITVLSDETMSYEPRTRPTREAWDIYRIWPGTGWSGITQFLVEAQLVFQSAAEAWDKTLDSIDKLVQVNLSDFIDDERVEDLMFDSSFTRSKDYFVALQILRLVDEWVDEGVERLRELQDSDDFHSLVRFRKQHDEENWDQAIRNMEARAQQIKHRVATKSEEIKSLRDGLFNATSLREATKAMALNQAIYIFTIVTVLFTPVSFLATFWALPFLNNPKEDGSEMVPEPPAFRNTMIILPLLTYALVMGIAWYMRPGRAALYNAMCAWPRLAGDALKRVKTWAKGAREAVEASRGRTREKSKEKLPTYSVGR